MKKFLILIVFSFILSGCDALSGSNEITLAQLENQLKEIREFVLEGKCSQTGECNYIAVGSKACGGPMGYIVYSTNIDVEALKKMVDKYTADQKTYNIQNNVISDCSLANPPEKIGCVDGNCVEIR